MPKTRAFLISLAAFSFVRNVEARPEAPALFCGLYAESPLCREGPPACALCHGAAPALNAFGEDIARLLPRGEFSLGLSEALALVEPLDSDLDAESNALEIASGSWPGDPLSPHRPRIPPAIKTHVARSSV